MIVEFEGQQHDFPDNFSQDDIAKALSTYKPPQGPLDRAGQEMAQTFKGGVQAVTDLGAGKPEDYLGPSGMLRSAKETGRAILGPVEATLGAVGSGIASLGASGLGAAQRGLEKGIAAGTEYFSPKTAEKMRENIPSSQQAYETALPYAHAALGAVRGVPTVPRAPSLPPPLSASQQAVEAAARGGYTLPRYAATEGTVIPQVASSIKNVPWGGQPIVLTHDELLANMGRSASEIAPGAGTPETAGQAAKSGLTGFIKAESQKPIGEAYKAVDELINPDVRVPLDNTRDMIGQIMAERTRARIPGQSKAVQTVFDAVQDPRGMDYAGTKSLRSFLGEKSPIELATQGLAPTEVKRIYGAMSKDLGNVVLEAGGPEAFTAWKEANALTRLTKMQQEALSKVVGAQGDAAPEMVFNRLATYANSRAGADLNRLRLAKKAMGPDAWNEIGSALISRLGRAPDEAFSPQRFVTAFGNMAPAARNELFSGQQQAALADLFTVSKHIHDRITRFGNPSGTARGSFIGQAITGTGLWADPISTLITLVGARVASAALARPAVVRAATRVARASLTGNPYAKQRAMAALLTVVQAEGLVPRQQDQQQLPRMQYGGRPTGPTIVGEAGPEVFVPDQPGTIVPSPFDLAAARQARAVRPPGGRQEGAGTAFAEGGYGIPAAYRALDRSAQDAFGASNELTWGADPQAAEQAAGTMFKQSLGAAGAPLVAPAMEGAVLGAGAIRRAKPGLQAPAIRNPDAPLFDYSKLREVPDVPQRDLQRYEAPRGVPERTQALASPENIARVNDVVKRGAQQGGIEWYNTDPLRQAFIEARGPEGEAAYRQYLDLVASTSPRSNVGVNARNAAYYYGLAQRGEPLPEVIAKGGALSVKEALPSPYGHIAQGLHAQNARNVLEGGGWPVLQNPKPASFVENLAGNQMPVTVDTHNARLWGMTDTKGRPVNKPAKTEYGFMERLQQDEARKVGMTPAQYQASAWIGGGEQTGLRSSADPFLKVLEDRIRLTANQTGESPQDVLHRFLMGQNAPGRRGPLLSVTPVPTDTSRRD